MRHPSSQPDEAGHEAGPAARARGLLPRRQEVRSRPRYPSGPSPGRQPWRGQIKPVSPGRAGEARRRQPGGGGEEAEGRRRPPAAGSAVRPEKQPRAGRAEGTRPPPPFCGRAPPAALGPGAGAGRGGLRGRARPSLPFPPLPPSPPGPRQRRPRPWGGGHLGRGEILYTRARAEVPAQS